MRVESARPLTVAAPTSCAQLSDCSPAVVAVAQQLRDIARRRSLGCADVEQLVRALPGLSRRERELALTAVPFVFGGAIAPDDRRAAMRALGTSLAGHFQEPVDVGALDVPVVRVARVVRNVLAGLTVTLACWIVVGGLLEGDGGLLPARGPFTNLAVLALALLALGLLEAAHIGAASLAGADVSALAASHPRLQRLHRHIDTKDKLERYLGARQLGVVLIVFVIAEATRFTDLRELPGTTIAIPHAFDPLLSIGAPGALVVLALAQVAPQVIAAQQPATLMNSSLVSSAFYVTLAVGSLGLAKPGAWLVAAFRRHERIPSAPRVRYESVARDVDHHGIVTIRRELTIGEDEASLEAESAVEFYEGAALTSYVDSTFTVPGHPRALSVRSSLRREDATVPVVPGRLDDEPLPGGGLRLQSAASPVLGSFHAGDVLTTSLRATCPVDVGWDVVIVDRPVHVVLMRVRFTHPPVPLPPATLTQARIGEGGTTDLREESGTSVEPVLADDGTCLLTVTVLFPEPGTALRLSWGGDR